MKRNNEIIEIDLMEVLGVLVDRIGLILAAGLFCTLVTCMISAFLIEPTYESTTRIYILNRQESSGVTYSDVQIGTQLTKDYSVLITSRYVLESVAQKLGLDLTYKEMAAKVSVTSPTDTRIVAITVKDHDPVMAMDIANALREVASSHIQNVMNIEAVNVVETANMPTTKAGPPVVKWSLIGGIAGVFLVSVISVLQYLMDDTIKSAEDVQRYLGLSTLALIPVTDEVDDTGRVRKKRG